jgi:hypothetical protein
MTTKGQPGGMNRVLFANNNVGLSQIYNKNSDVTSIITQITDEWGALEKNYKIQSIEVQRKDKEITWLKNERLKVDEELRELGSMIGSLQKQLDEYKQQKNVDTPRQQMDVETHIPQSQTPPPITPRKRTLLKYDLISSPRRAGRFSPKSPLPKRNSAPMLSARGTGNMFKAKVLFSYYGAGPRQLSIEQGEIIDVLERSYTGQWMGRNKKNEHGFFPRNYVKMIEN